jgi:hypothetical protein
VASAEQRSYPRTSARRSPERVARLLWRTGPQRKGKHSRAWVAKLEGSAVPVPSRKSGAKRSPAKPPQPGGARSSDEEDWARLAWRFVLLVLLPGVPVLSHLQIHRRPGVAAGCGSTSRSPSGSSWPHPDWRYVLCGRHSGHDGGRQARESGTGVRRCCPPTRESAGIPAAQD